MEALKELHITPARFMGGNSWVIKIRMDQATPLMEGDAIPAGIEKNGVKIWKVDKILGSRPSVLFKGYQICTVNARLIKD